MSDVHPSAYAYITIRVPAIIAEVTRAKLTELGFDSAIVSQKESGNEPPSKNQRDDRHDERRIDPRVLPNLTHTKVLYAAVGGQTLSHPNWNLVLDQILVLSIKRVGGVDKLRQVCPVNVVKGRKQDEGFRHLPEIDISVQGQDANGACRAVVTAAQQLSLPVEVQFMWRQKEGAEYPGEMARLRIPQ
jgi:hypothetical protein